METTLLVRFALIASCWLVAPASAQVNFVVNSSADPGDGTCDATECTLREAITAANATVERDSIHFAIPGDGVHTIVLASPLPTVSQRAVIDGYTQPGASPNTLEVGTDAVLLVELDASAVANGIVLGGTTASSTVMRGLVINGAQSAGVLTAGFSIFIYGNYIGTDASGTVARGNKQGVNLNHSGATNIRIGSPDPADRNVISGNGDLGGIVVGGNPSLAPPDGFRIQGNYIGTDASGTGALGNAGNGIQIFHGIDALIGGLEEGAGNVIAANALAGITLNTNPNSGTLVRGFTVQGNVIGADATALAPLGNGTHGITVGVTGDHTIGGGEPGAGNVISNNAGSGIYVVGAQQLAVVEGNTIRMNGADGVELNQFGSGLAFFQFSRNAFAGNGGLAIDIKCVGDPDGDGGGPTPNDPGDADEGSNRCQNYPEIESAGITGDGDVVVTYAVDTDPAHATYPLTVEFFVAESPSEAEGEVFLGADTYTEDDWTAGGASPGTKQVNLGSAATLGVGKGDVIIGTATDADGYTSEFTSIAPVVVAADPDLERSTGGAVLLGPYPNPLRGAGLVYVETRRPQRIRLAVFDVLGREVAVLSEGQLAPGRHAVPFTTSRWRAGLYFVRLTDEEGSRSHPLTVLR